MKKLGSLVMFVAVGTMLSGCVSTGPTQSAVSAGEAEKITEEITELARQWGRVPITKNTDHLKRIFADEFSLVMTDGNVFDKEALIALIEKDIKEKTNTFTSIEHPVFNVRVYGKNFAVANGVAHAVGKDKDGNSFSRKGRGTAVWVRKNGTWQVVAGHSSRLE
jgi:ketosteroid isomerase-like protein